MKPKIETLGRWGAQACLHSALEEVEHDDTSTVMYDERGEE